MEAPEVRVGPSGTRGPQPSGLVRLYYRLVGPLSARQVKDLVGILTVGARSGQRRLSTIRSFPEDGDNWLVVASFGGSRTHPAWFLNLARHPDQVWLRIKGREVHVRPVTLDGEERERAWQRIVREQPHFSRYQTGTDREIPVIRLTAS